MKTMKETSQKFLDEANSLAVNSLTTLVTDICVLRDTYSEKTAMKEIMGEQEYGTTAVIVDVCRQFTEALIKNADDIEKSGHVNRL